MQEIANAYKRLETSTLIPVPTPIKMSRILAGINSGIGVESMAKQPILSLISRTATTYDGAPRDGEELADYVSLVACSSLYSIMAAHQRLTGGPVVSRTSVVKTFVETEEYSDRIQLEIDAMQASILSEFNLFRHVTDTWVGVGDDPLPAVMGLVGELGETIDYYKKMLFKPGFTADYEHLREELGDVGYYVGAVFLVAGQDEWLETHSTETSMLVNTSPITTLVNMNHTAAELLSDYSNIDLDMIVDLPGQLYSVCSKFGYDLRRVMYYNRKKLMGGRHGWPTKENNK